MLDYFCIFTKGGALLWTIQLTALRGNPIDVLVRSVRNCLLEERSGERSFSWTPVGRPPLTMKWTLHNGLGLVFVAVYQRALKLLYVDDLLERVKEDFKGHYKPDVYDYKQFEETFQRLLKEAEDSTLLSRPVGSGGKGAKDGDTDGSSLVPSTSQNSFANGASGTETEQSGNETGGPRGPGNIVDTSADSGNEAGAFDTSAISKKLAKRPPMAKPRRLAGMPCAGTFSINLPRILQEARVWAGSNSGSEALDFSEKPEGKSGSDADSASDAVAANLQQKSLVDVDEDFDSEEEDEEVAVAAAGKAAPKSGGILSSLVRNIGMNIAGTAALTYDDIQPGLVQLKRKLMERNVAEEIAAKLCESVTRTLEGQRLGSFTRVSSAVRTAVEEAITRILTPKRSIDVLREAQQAKARGKPYVIVFVGVNGVGKSTNLAKIAYWLLQNKMTVQIAACDTFRSGAVEQLRTHCNRLNVPLYERGYEKDPAKVAFEAVKVAQRSNIDVVLVDTAGRMQDNEPLMRALSNLISLNEPDLTLFVGEALVGNDAVDQLTKFNQRLADLARTPNAQMIQGLVLTKMDTIDDKVGAALSMVYVSGAPIMFVGCGQTYVDLKRLNVKSVVRSLLK
eukprot:jgi/Astpho2/6558/e_gw1.00099.7.1_t